MTVNKSLLHLPARSSQRLLVTRWGNGAAQARPGVHCAPSSCTGWGQAIAGKASNPSWPHIWGPAPPPPQLPGAMLTLRPSPSSQP